MPFIPHTDQDIEEMLKTIGIKELDTLFEEIPDSLKQAEIDGAVPAGISEMELGRLMRARAELDNNLLCFIGAGAYEHHIPAAVWEVATRGEFMTAYTPYQAEASQGTLQLIYEYQTMMASLMGMEVSNASLYEGASALAEAVLMAVRLSKKNKSQILMPRNINPFYRQTVQAIVAQQNIKLVDVNYDEKTGQVDIAHLKQLTNDEVGAFVIPQPNFFGILEDVDYLSDWAHEKGILTIALVNPMAMALLKPPGQWGKHGVDIACGEGQPLGIPLASGGPYYGFLCCRKADIRNMPGRVVGRTVDAKGRTGYVLTLQAREQHIRRAKANSNICTNQGLMVTAATIYMSLLGPKGLRRVAAMSHQRTRELFQEISKIPGVTPVFTGPFFNEVVFRINKPIEQTLQALAERRIQGGYALKTVYPELGDSLLICATETKTSEDIKFFARQLWDVLSGRKLACLA